MVKQYVGARYVPKFASPLEWAADTSYEALTIVTFNNASYTSKIQVPPTVGNPANNPKYWALTGNYNAQVEQYRQETIQVKNEITESQNALKNEVTESQNALKNEVTESQNALKIEITEDQNALKNEVTQSQNALKNEVKNEVTESQNAFKNEVTESQNNFQSTLTTNYSNLKQEVNNLTLSAGNPQATSAEITAARGAYSTLSERLNNNVSVFPSTQYITKDNYNTYLTDANAAIPNNIYRIVISASSTAFPAHLPVTTNNGTYGHSSVCYLFTLLNQKMGDSLCDIQIFYDFNDNKIWSRAHNINGKVGWGEWQTLYDANAFTPRKIMHIGANDNFAQKIIKAYEENYTEVHVDNGTYNVQDNLKAMFGSLEAQYNNNQYKTGLPLGNGIKYIFNSNAVVTLNYTGTNENVESTLSLFAAYPGNYELHGGTFITNNVRYTIHDERFSSEGSYYHEYDGCRLEHTSSSDSKGNVQTIGGGLGENGTIYIHDCFFKTITSKYEKVGTVSYHNGSDNKCKSRLVVRDNYFDLDNTLRISWYGASDLITLWLVSNNSFGSDIEYRAESTDSTHVNMKYKAWNNEVRT